MTNLQLSLRGKWFEMTKARIKPEDYREINQYWVNRLLWHEFHKEVSCIHSLQDAIYGLSESDSIFKMPSVFRSFTQNTMTLGYPKATDTERILVMEHKGIEIRTGNPEWGAEPDKLYFVIKHGEVLNNQTTKIL